MKGQWFFMLFLDTFSGERTMIVRVQIFAGGGDQCLREHQRSGSRRQSRQAGYAESRSRTYRHGFDDPPKEGLGGLNFPLMNDIHWLLMLYQHPTL